MTLREWLSKSKDWHEGYRAYVFNYTITEEKSEEFFLGFNYACQCEEKYKGKFPFVEVLYDKSKMDNNT